MLWGDAVRPDTHTDQMEEEAKRLCGLFSLAKRSGYGLWKQTGGNHHPEAI